MAEKTLGQVAYAKWCDESGNRLMTTEESWQAVADAVIAAYEARRWKAAFANLPAPPKEANDAE